MDLGDTGFGEVNDGAQSLLGSLDTLIGKMRALSGEGKLAADQQVELYNLAGERARLVAEINESPNVEREQNAGSWIERLTTDVERGKTRAVDAMGALTQAQLNLEQEMQGFEGIDVMTPEQEAKFAMLQRLIWMLTGGIEDFEARVAEANQADMFRGLKESIQGYIGEQERIPERILTKFESAGGDRSFYDDYNSKFEQLDASQRDLLTIQGELANGPLLMARNQVLAGQAVDATANRAEALRTALASAYSLNPDTAGLQNLFSLWEQELAIVDAAVTREEGLAASAAEVVAQRQAAASALSQADAAAKAAAVAGGDALAQQEARVNSLRSSLSEVGENSISGQRIAAELEPALRTLEQMQRFWESQGTPDADAVLVELLAGQYGNLSDALRAVGLAADSSDPLVAKLIECFMPTELDAKIQKAGELAAAIRNIEAAQAAGFRPRQQDLDIVDARGMQPGQFGLETFTPDAAAFGDATRLLANYNRGLIDVHAYASKFLNVENALQAAIEAAVDEGDYEKARKYTEQLEKLSKVAAELSRQKIELEVKTAQVETGDITADEFAAWGRGQIEELRAKQAALAPQMVVTADATDEQKQAAQEAAKAWLDYQASVAGIEGKMANVTTFADALMVGMQGLAMSLRNVEGGEGLAAWADGLSGVGAGLSEMLKGGSIVDGIKFKSNKLLNQQRCWLSSLMLFSYRAA